ncbi:hypothetical protein C8R43DRAFT_543344 [Mycena crocata]|nr:hypothetical protein C8R43DRAFT_543344 [Mycena crocata]
MDFRNTRLSRPSSTPNRTRRFPLTELQLPRKWLKKEYPDSVIFTPFFSDIRHLMLTGEPTPDSAIPLHLNGALSQLIPGLSLDNCDFPKDQTYLHLAVLHADLPLAYESVILGTSVQSKDSEGCSALYNGCRHIALLMREGEIVHQSLLSQFHPNYSLTRMQELLVQVRRICHFLIIQHSDPNELHGGLPLLKLACIAGSWDLIRALLLHGANPTPSSLSPEHHPIRFLEKKSAKARFKALISELSTVPRPPRICPCGSERPLKDCHADPQPWCPEYICCCGSRKIYSNCCALKRDTSWTEYWNAEKDWLDFGPSIHRSIRATDPDATEFDVKCAMLASGMALDRTNFRWLDEPNLFVLQVLTQQRRVDPGYAAACKQTMMVPSPTVVRLMLKIVWINSMKAWNKAVDTYIASGVDHRASKIIEAAAKVGLAGGPLHCKCDAVGCGTSRARTPGRRSLAVPAAARFVPFI